MKKDTSQFKGRVIPGTNDCYSITKRGDVFRIKGGPGARAGHRLTPYKDRWGNRKVKIKIGDQTRAQGHRLDFLILKTFSPDVLKKPYIIGRKDRDRANHRLSNLLVNSMNAQVKKQAVSYTAARMVKVLVGSSLFVDTEIADILRVPVPFVHFVDERPKWSPVRLVRGFREIIRLAERE